MIHRLIQYQHHDWTNPSIEFFLKHIQKDPSVLEIGTKRWREDDPTHHKFWFFTQGVNASEYVMTDVTEGMDVDKVSDAHALSGKFGENRFDAIWSSSVWEHLHSPWIASREVIRTLKPGGVFFIQTHFTFCEHGYPEDYFRFTTKALEHLFKEAQEVVACYDFPVIIQSVNPIVNQSGYFNSCIAGRI